MHKRKWFALIIGLSFFSLAAVAYASTTTYFDPSELVVSVPAQPVSSIVPSGALHVPFTKFDLSARGTDIIVTSITVIRVGPADDAAFEDIELLDGDGNVLADGSLDDDHTVEFTEPLHIPRDTTLHITVAANMAEDLSEFDGQMSRFVVTQIAATGYVALQ